MIRTFILSFVSVGLSLTMVSAALSATTGDCCTPCPTVAVCQKRPHDQLWLVNARSGCLNQDDLSGGNLRYFLKTNTGWAKSNAAIFNDDLYASMPTVVWVHGDRVSSSEAYSIGQQVYRKLTSDLPSDLPLRFVIYSWPSTQQKTRPLVDARIKFGYTTAAGYRLGYILAHLPTETPVSLIGYSYGSRVTTAGLHFLGGGEIGRWALAERPEQRAPVRATLLAAAVGNGMILPGSGHGLAIASTERTLLLRNSADRVLKFYPRLNQCGRGPQALGAVGIAERQLGNYAEQFEQVDVACQLGRAHQWQGYFHSRGVLDRVRGNLALDTPAATAASTPVKQPLHVATAPPSP